MRGANQHLSGEEIEQLTSIAPDAAVGALEGAMRHLERCEQCRFRMLLSEQDLSRAPLGTGGGPQRSNSQCPPETTWLDVAAGLGTKAERKRLMEHAASCARCGPLLKQAVEDLGMELTVEEETKVAALASAQPKWHSDLAKKIAESAPPKAPVPAKPSPSPRKFIFWPRWAVALASLIVAAGGGWWAWILLRAPSVEELLAQAYTEQRTIEMRISGAAYAPQYAKRGDQRSRADRSQGLLQAEPLAARQLRQHPDDAKWLHAQGLVDLLEGNYTASVTGLEKASRLDPVNVQISIDLASAYFARGEHLDRKDDFGNAVQLLGAVISKHPENQIAIFNRAIAEERVFLYTDAEADWKNFLKLDSASQWAAEARERLTDVQQKIQQQKDRSSKPLLSPADVAARIAKGQEPDIEEIDKRIEQYLDLAIKEWIPMIFSQRTSVGQAALSARQGVEAIAGLLISRHGDNWLRDFFRELQTDPASPSHVQTLAEAVDMSDSTSLGPLAKLQNEFRDGGGWAGEMRALLESARANQLAHQNGHCEEEAVQLTERKQIASYPWLHIQALLELAVCGSLGDEQARNYAEEALRLAKSHDFGGLQLRAMTFLGAFYRIMGNSVRSWQYLSAGLALFWGGDYPAMRGYGFYTELDRLAEDTQQWFLDVSAIQEAVSTVSDDPHLLQRAVEHERFAKALLLTGNLSESEENLRIASDLFSRSPPSERRNNLEAEVQIGLASIDLVRNQPQEAIDRLERLRPRVARMADKDIQFEFMRDLGLAYLRASNNQAAQANLESAVALAEDSLHANSRELDRFIWSRKVESVYRALVQLKVQVSPQEAFARWEWYKASSLRGLEVHPKLVNMSSQLLKLPAAVDLVPGSAALISYVFIPDRLAVWVYDSQGLRQAWTTTTASEIGTKVRLFSEHCSDPHFDLEVLKGEGRVLYRELFAPIEPLVAARNHLVIETDGVLGLLPFEALMDSNGTYLGDRWSVSFSPGLYYLLYSRPWNGVSSQSKALVVGIPSAGNFETATAIEREVGRISEFFPNHHLLLRNEATFTRIAQALAESDVFHFAGHAVASAAGVGLILGDSSLLDVEALDRSAFRSLRLITLSACSTAIGSSGTFEEHESLARLLVGAGIPEVVASRWVVESESTGSLMQDFYQELLSGKGASDGLHQAILKLRARQLYAHPYYWAGFAVFGRG